MTEIARVIALGLICWRLTSLLVEEDGPLDIFAKLRRFIGVYYDEMSVKQGKNVIAKGLLCVWCTSIWVASPLALFAPYSNYPPTIYSILEWLGYVLVISTLAIIVDGVAYKS